jgi:hypothetical protein
MIAQKLVESFASALFLLRGQPAYRLAHNAGASNSARLLIFL